MIFVSPQSTQIRQIRQIAQRKRRNVISTNLKAELSDNTKTENFQNNLLLKIPIELTNPNQAQIAIDCCSTANILLQKQSKTQNLITRIAFRLRNELRSSIDCNSLLPN